MLGPVTEVRVMHAVKCYFIELQDVLTMLGSLPLFILIPCNLDFGNRVISLEILMVLFDIHHVL